jgi:hypothetical protein
MAGFTVRNRHQSRQGRKKWSAVPGGTWKIGLPVFPAINGRAILADNKAGNRRGDFVLAPSARHIFSHAMAKKFQPRRGGIIRRFPKYFAPERSWKIY